MNQAIFIKRKPDQEDPLQFQGLVREGRRLLQEMSGELWSDYNAHDPGVTILEAICFGLSDVIARTGFPVEDLLTNEQGILDQDRLGLHPPETIFPCRPTTLEDYRRLLLDRVPELDNLWLFPEPDDALPGVYTIECRLDPDFTADQARICAEITSQFMDQRNLCEDLGAVHVLDENPCTLHGLLEINDQRSPAEILAEVFHLTNLHILGELDRPEETEAANITRVEDFFDGPSLQRANPGGLPLSSGEGEILINDIFTLVNGIEGVVNVKSLWLELEGARFYTALPRMGPKGLLRLHIPTLPAELQVRVEAVGGREIPVVFQRFQARYADQDNRYQSARRMILDTASLFPKPDGTWRDFGSYTSIGFLLPAAYNIGPYGVPDSAPAEVKGRAAQLKGYLLLFDQFLANYAADLHHIQDLFAIDSPGKASYCCQEVRNEAHPSLSFLYPPQSQKQLENISADFDSFFERKNRVLDYLLALYGENFPQAFLANFAHYCVDPQGEATALLEKKASFLRSIVELGRDRAGGDDYTTYNTSRFSQGGFHKRISLLLGFQETEGDLCGPLNNLGLSLADAALPSQPEPIPYTVSTALPVYFEIVENNKNTATLYARCREDLPQLNELLTAPFLRGATQLSHFHLQNTGNTDVALWFQESTQHRPKYLATTVSREQSNRLANDLRCLCLELNQQNEGVHVVEHLLLRPKGGHAHEGVSQKFYPFQISLLFPGWTLRCHDPKFQAFAEDIIYENTPAHIFPHIHWLNFSAMDAFEHKLSAWRIAQANPSRSDKQIDGLAYAIINFLQDIQKSPDRSCGVSHG